MALSDGDMVLSNAIILAAVGVLKGNRLIGGSLSGCSPFLPECTGLARRSDSDMTDDLREESPSLGVSSAAIASARDSTVGLAVIGVSSWGRLDECAEKNGWSISLAGDS